MAARPIRFTCRPTFPAKDFWSFVVYDNQTRSDAADRCSNSPASAAQTKGIVINPDTSVDVWFGPTAPEGS